MWHKYAVEERVRQVEPIPPGAENEFFRYGSMFLLDMLMGCCSG